MLPIIDNAKPRATDWGSLLDQNPSRVQSPELSFATTLLKWKRTRKPVPLPNPWRGDQVESLELVTDWLGLGCEWMPWIESREGRPPTRSGGESAIEMSTASSVR